MLSGELYSPQTKELAEDRARAKMLLHRFNHALPTDYSERAAVLRELIPNAPKDLYIEAPFQCDYGSNITCGKRVYFNVNCVVLDAAGINIGSHVFIGPSVHIYAATHPMESDVRRTRALAKGVTIGDDCWIGGGAIICPGVTIGKGCVIGAGAVVTRNIPDNSLAVGNPARVIKRI